MSRAKRIVKYILLFGLGLATIYHQLPIGDYCTGLAQGLHFLCLVGLFAIMSVIILAIDLIKFLHQKIKFDFVPTYIVIFFCISLYLILNLDNRKFWTEIQLIGVIDTENIPSNGKLILYKDGSFGASFSMVEQTCTFSGSYLLTNTELKLNRADISYETKGRFTDHYFYEKKSRKFISKKDGFPFIGVIKMVE